MFFLNLLSHKNSKYIIFIFLVVCIAILLCFAYSSIFQTNSNDIIDKFNVSNFSFGEYLSSVAEEYSIDKNSNNKSGKTNSYIKWIDFKGTAEIMSKLTKLDIASHVNNDDIKLNWIELMALLACKYGGEFSKFKQADLDSIINELKSGKTACEIGSQYQLYNYYYESLDAIFHEYVGNYSIQVDDGNSNKIYKTNYGIKVFSPIAQGYSFSHYKDFGASRSYGYKRVHLGNDILRQHRNSYYRCRIWICRSFRLESIWWLENWYSQF